VNVGKSVCITDSKDSANFTDFFTFSIYKMAEELKYKEITEKIIGSAFDVHSFLGNGFTHRCN
jgi:hypothetical protein